MRHSAGVGSRDQNDFTMIERVDPLLGTVLDGKYRLEFRLAAGGFGAIYRARQVETDVELAVKVVHARLASDPGIVARFQREGQALTALRSRHTITAYELGETPEGVLYIAMELLHGVNLFERFRVAGPLPWRRVIGIALGVCDSLAEAHGLGIVHRDLKPTNIHLERRGAEEDFVKVLDFGIAKILQHSQFDNQDLTSAGLMIGTIDYMSPEQMVGGEITGASDLYTLGIVIYEMIAGRRPFTEAPTPASVLAAMLKPPPPLRSVAIVSAELDRVVMRCLERDPDERYQTAGELAADLQRLLQPVEVRPRSFERDDDATQLVPKRVTAMLMGAAPPPALTPSRAGPAVSPRRSTPPPLQSTPTRASQAVPPPPPAPPALPLPPPSPARANPPTPAPAAPLRGHPPTPAPATPYPWPAPLAGPISTMPLPGLVTQAPPRGMAHPQTPDPARPGDPTTVEAPAGRRQFDMARNEMVGRVVWICVLVIAGVIGIVLFARL